MDSTEEIAIRIQNISKNFRLPNEKYNSLKSHVVHPFKHRGYKTQQALKDINIEIKKGEFFGIVGRNGSGKSTLLKIIAGIYQPTSGKLSVGGKLVPFIELGVGFNPELTGKENVYLNGALLGFSPQEIDTQYTDIVAFAELEDFMNQKLKNYSSGMQVRLAFSMAIRAKADILLIDEVLAVGDADFQRKCYDYFKKLKKEKRTVIFVSHDMDAVREYCDRAMLIEKSKAVTISGTAEIAEKYLKLFERTNTKNNQQGLENRWGDRAVYFKDIAVDVSDKTIKIREIIRAKSEIDPAIAGFRIRDAAGHEVTGTNTRIEKIKLPVIKTGEQILLEWKLPNLLSDGTYYVDPAVLHADGITVADWWNDAARFEVKKQRHLPYKIDPGFSLEISNS